MANLAPPLRKALASLEVVQATAETHELRTDADELVAGLSEAIEIRATKDQEDDEAILHVVHHHAGEMQTALQEGDLQRVIDHGQQLIFALPDGAISDPKDRDLPDDPMSDPKLSR